MTPFKSSFLTVKPEWIDYNGHLNMAYYSVLFDLGVDDVWSDFGLGPGYREERGMTTFLAEFHIRYIRELHEGDRVYSTFQLLAHDEKRIHSYQELFHEDGWLAASGESLHLSIDQSGPKVAPFPGDVQEKIAKMARDHAGLPMPEGAGRKVQLRPR
ncbi:thioesterase family protein [Heliomarina baculiformis]|uniref:thioesterase family protein n=1 Tax=Heliomarina baculiformis TaxID=2872036 RepID=UPI001EE1A3A0|nr:thioesterase family protein [Heliomarina baculiformis]